MMTLSEILKLVLYAVIVILFAVAIHEPAEAGHTDPRKPDHMAMQSIPDMPGYSHLCTTAFQMRVGDGWSDPKVRCVVIETPNYNMPELHKLCDAVGPEDDYIRCPS